MTRTSILLAIITAIATLVTAASLAQTSTTPVRSAAGETPQARERITERRARLAERSAELEARLAAEIEDSALHAELRAELDLVERIDRLHSDQLAAIAQADGLDQTRESIERQLAAGPSEHVTSKPPYPLALLDGLWDALDGQSERLRVLEQALERAQAELDSARRRFESQERERREVKEAAGAVAIRDDEIELARRRRALQLEELESELASLRAEFSELQMANAERALATQRQAEALVRGAVLWVEERLTVSAEELAEPLDRVAEDRFDLEGELERAKQQLEVAEGRLRGVQERIADGAALEGEIEAELAARQLEQRVSLRGVEFLERRVSRLDVVGEWWERRLRVLSSQASNVEMREWKREVTGVLDDWSARQRLERLRLAELSPERSRLAARLDDAKGQPEARWLAEHLQQLDRLMQLYANEIRDVDDRARLLDRTLAGIGRRDTRLTTTERIAWFAQQILGVWTTELTSFDDRPITVGKLFTAFVLVFAGYSLARQLSRWLGALLRRRSRLEAGASAAFQSLTFYVLLLAFLLMALRTANIPLTVFTLAGGAVAIGIGFGSQNIINNFMSGLILLVERPIKVGDLVEVDGTQGYVDHIGARSTVVRTFDNTNIIMPNSTFLETNVVNWTLSDLLVRSRIDVGVAYGSPTREVERLLQEIVLESPDVLARPEPFVRFRDFGDDALLFGAYFWLSMGHDTDRLRIQSELRHAIAERFEAAGIEIAFPQRDLHLKSAVPMRVEMVDPE